MIGLTVEFYRFHLPCTLPNNVRKKSFLFPSKKPTDIGNMFKYFFPLVLINALVLNFLSSGIKKVLKLTFIKL